MRTKEGYTIHGIGTLTTCTSTQFTSTRHMALCWSLRPFLLGSVTLLVGAFTPCSIHDDCREVDFCHKSGRCLPCIQGDFLRNSATGTRQSLKLKLGILF